MLNNSVNYLPAIGPTRAEVLKSEVEIETNLDLLHYFPYRYVDRSRFYTVSELTAQMPYVQLTGIIRAYREEGSGRSKRLVATFSDETGTLDLVWFRGAKYITSQFPAGAKYIIFGKPTLFNHRFNISHPEITLESQRNFFSSGLTPLYYTTEKMKRSGLNTKRLKEAIQRLVIATSKELKETLPSGLVSQLTLMSYPDAIRAIHFPRNAIELEAAQKRLKFEELFFLQLRLLSIKGLRKQRFQGIPFEKVGELFNRFYREFLPFELTKAQKRVVREIRRDCNQGHQMNRLVQGDVGSGKTMVALLSMLLALDNNCQACMMAPTEILARQHYEGLSSLLERLGIEVGLLKGSTTKGEREILLSKLASGELKIIVGTHALLENNVVFKRLGLAVIDEQHRFGVDQRARLWAKNLKILPHVLIMSATPIPRTLAMTLYGDLDISIIDELPPGRKAIETVHRYENEMPLVFSFLRSVLDKGRQAYVVFPMIEESEKDDLKNLEEGFATYSAQFPTFNIDFVHGKMRPKDKEAVMQRFASGTTQILLSTTVIEVGVNVPNASVMIIEDAGRFGLSQLHQLRGRVGRGAEQSYCILVTSRKLGADSIRRLQVMTRTNDGFEIAEEDMRIRGFGEIEGTRQSGRELNLRIANLARDGQLISLTRSVAEHIISTDANLQKPEHQMLKERLTLLNRRSEAVYGVIS